MLWSCFPLLALSARLDTNTEAHREVGIKSLLILKALLNWTVHFNYETNCFVSYLKIVLLSIAQRNGLTKVFFGLTMSAAPISFYSLIMKWNVYIQLDNYSWLVVAFLHLCYNPRNITHLLNYGPFQNLLRHKWNDTNFVLLGKKYKIPT